MVESYLGCDRLARYPLSKIAPMMDVRQSDTRPCREAMSKTRPVNVTAGALGEVSKQGGRLVKSAKNRFFLPVD
jgi:hypothetical protein